MTISKYLKAPVHLFIPMRIRFETSKCHSISSIVIDIKRHAKTMRNKNIIMLANKKDNAYYNKQCFKREQIHTEERCLECNVYMN